MKTDQFSKWSSIAEILSSVAIFITLVFVLVEIRQNTETIEQNGAWMRLALLDAGYEQNAEFRRLLLTDKDVFRLWREGCESPLAEVDAARYDVLARDYLILQRNVGERSLALGGQELLEAQAQVTAETIVGCRAMRAIFDKELAQVRQISPEWSIAVSEALGALSDGKN